MAQRVASVRNLFWNWACVWTGQTMGKKATGPMWKWSRCMAGHSKWQNIRHIKALKDNAKSQVINKYCRYIRQAVVEGGPDPKLNSRLNAIIQEARHHHVPNTSIETSIKKGSACKSRPALYALKGPNNCILLVDVETENMSITTHTIKQLCRKHSASIIGEDRAKHLFDQKGIITAESVNGAITEPSSNEALEIAIEVGAEDVQETTDEADKHFLQFVCAPNDLFKVKKNLESTGKYTVREAKVHFIPQRTVPLSNDDMEVMGKLCESLEELPEVIVVYDNVQ